MKKSVIFVFKLFKITIMKKLLMNVFVVAALAATTVACKNDKKTTTTDAQETAKPTAEAVAYKVSTNNSTLKWEGAKVIGGKHFGTVNLKEGVFSVKEGVIESGKVVIDMNSINATDVEGEEKEMLEGHLKGTNDKQKSDFFDVKDFPTATFEVTGHEKGKALKGNLTLKGITNNIEVPVKVSEENGMLTLVSEPFTIDRTDWKINFNSGSVFKDVAKDRVISDNFTLQFTVKAKK